MTRRIIQTRDGDFQVWNANNLIGVCNRDDNLLRALKHGDWISLGQADNAREIAELLDDAGIR